jgi:hypothetical protein
MRLWAYQVHRELGHVPAGSDPVALAIGDQGALDVSHRIMQTMAGDLP